MAQSQFPHLHFSYVGKLKAKFPRSFRTESEAVTEIKRNRHRHAATLRGVLEGLESDYRETLEKRGKSGLPLIEAGKGFVLHLSDGADADAIAHALGVELVAEAEDGFILVATEDLTFQKLRLVLDLFESGQDGGGSGATVLEAFGKPDDVNRLSRILSKEVEALWPFEAKKEYVFDLSIQTAPSLRTVKFQRAVQRKGESDEAFTARKRGARDKVYESASDAWMQSADSRFAELSELVSHFKGKMLSGYSNDPEKESDNGVIFPDCIYVRVQMCGEGFQDVIYNLPHLFEVALPEEVEAIAQKQSVGEVTQPEVGAPIQGAPVVCVIDSGIQENHLWLASAIDRKNSRCFLPSFKSDMVQDEVKDAGHGTRVAGAVLYPSVIPKAGAVVPIAWIQNARVLNGDNRVPLELPPARYLEEVVKHFALGERQTKIFNHSIAAGTACHLSRMSAWASKIDELSEKYDVLFVQAAGNLAEYGTSKNRPGIVDHRQAGREYPAYLLEDSARISNPAQSLHALTVGSVSGSTFDGHDLRSFGSIMHAPASYTRSGFGMWNNVKPDVVEVGGDNCREKDKIGQSFPRGETAEELLCSTLYGAPAYAKDGVGTSFAAPKVAHIAAQVQTVFPSASPLLYRALVVQSARWPDWANSEKNKDRVLRLIGFGRPDVSRATENSAKRITLITADAVEIRNYELHLYTVSLPEELRAIADETKIRVEVTLSYTSEPRRTRRSRYGYLRTRVDWRSSGLGEPAENFRKRELGVKGLRKYTQPQWTLHFMNQHGEAEETNRDRGTVQKDWALCEPHELASAFSISVRAHPGWDHRKDEGSARYCLAVSFEAVGTEVPIYTMIAESQVPVRSETQVEVPME